MVGPRVGGRQSAISRKISVFHNLGFSLKLDYNGSLIFVFVSKDVLRLSLSQHLISVNWSAEKCN